MNDAYVDSLKPNQVMDTVLATLPKLLSSRRFYLKFARRLDFDDKDDLVVRAARTALETEEAEPLDDNIDRLSRMTACIALTGCLARGFEPVESMGEEVVLEACARLVEDVPGMLECINDFRDMPYRPYVFKSPSNPLMN